MTDPNAAFAAAAGRHQAGDLAGAEALYRALLAEHPGHVPTLCNLGVLQARAGRRDEAAHCYPRALTLEPPDPPAHINHRKLKPRPARFEEAAGHYRSCLAANPDHAAALFNLGLVALALGDPAGAAECYRRVTALEPGHADGFGRLGDALLRCGQLAESVAAFRTAAGLKPDDPRALHNLGMALTNAGQYAEADGYLRSALRLNPNYAEAHNALGLNLEAQNQIDDAHAHYREAVRLKPDYADGWSNLGTSLSEQGRADEAIECLRESLRHRPGAPAVHSNLILIMNYSSRIPPEAVRDESLRWAERFAGPAPAPPPIPNPHDPDRRMRIGYLSADFRGHTVAGFIETLLRHHDRGRVEVHAYASVVRPDEITRRLQGLADHWRSVGGMSDRQIVAAILEDKLDVLIDLSGHTAGNRLTVLAARPAPVQLTLFGYPNTTGMAAVDYRVTDAVSDPPGMAEHLYTEKLLRLPEVPWVYTPTDPSPNVSALPAMEGKPFTFGCLNNPAKLSDDCLATWAALLRAIPGTRLILLAGQSQVGAKRLADHFAKAGILRDRVELLPRMPRTEYLEAHRRFDLTLDPFPYNGGITTGDSLWMGVPVLTVAGSRYLARQGAMVMGTVGLGEFVADSPEGLIQLARQWVERRSELAAIRAGLRERLRRSPLADGPRYVRFLEDALRQVWRERLPR